MDENELDDEPDLQEKLAGHANCFTCHRQFSSGGGGELMPKLFLCCSHSFCVECVTGFLRSPRPACPVCLNALSNGTAEEYGTDFALLSIAEVVPQEQECQGYSCGECQRTVVATHACKKCATFLCRLHALSHHRSKDSYYHKIITLSKLLAEEISLAPDVCSRHFETEVCDSCKQRFCVPCGHDTSCPARDEVARHETDVHGQDNSDDTAARLSAAAQARLDRHTAGTDHICLTHQKAPAEETGSEHVSERVESELECSVCMDPFSKGNDGGKEPKILPCRHIICQKCLQRILRSEAKCPTCRSALPRQPARSFPTHGGLLLLAARVEEGDTEWLLECALCVQPRRATYVCMQCKCGMCQMHAIAHKRALAGHEHQVLTSVGLLRAKKAQKLKELCKTHLVKSGVCAKCNDQFCSECTRQQIPLSQQPSADTRTCVVCYRLQVQQEKIHQEQQRQHQRVEEEQASGVDSSQELNSKGTAAFKAGEYARAISLFSRAINAGEINVELLSNRSAAWLKAGRPDKALADALACVRRDAAWSKGYLRLASAFELLGNTQAMVHANFAGQKVNPACPKLEEFMNQDGKQVCEEGVPKHKFDLSSMYPKGSAGVCFPAPIVEMPVFALRSTRNLGVEVAGRALEWCPFPPCCRELAIERGLSELPPKVLRLSNLESLLLDRNTISKLGPSSFASLPYLRTLSLAQNALSSIPPTLFTATTLTHLSLAGNQMASLPEDLGCLRALKVLLLNTNKLQTLPKSTAALTNLTHLVLSHNSLRAVPSSLRGLTAILTLDLTFNRRISSLPTWLISTTGVAVEFGKLPGREMAPDGKHWFVPGADGTAVVLVPAVGEEDGAKALAVIVNSQAQRLSLPGMGLSKVPLYLQNMTALRRLRMDDNAIEKLPEWLSGLHMLAELSVAGNQLSDAGDALIGAGEGLSRLTALDFARNQLRSLPRGVLELTGLLALDLSENRLQELPVGMERLQQLRKLNLRHNLLAMCPRSLGLLTRLSSLDLTQNFVVGLPAWALPMLQQQAVDASTGRVLPGGAITENWRESVRMRQVPQARAQCPFCFSPGRIHGMKDGLKGAGGFVVNGLASHPTRGPWNVYALCYNCGGEQIVTVPVTMVAPPVSMLQGRA